MDNIIGRTAEKELFSEILNGNRSEFIAVYGRRAVQGKSSRDRTINYFRNKIIVDLLERFQDYNNIEERKKKLTK